MHRLILLLAMSSGCVATSYVFSATTKGEVARTPGPNGCEFTVLQAPPEEDYEEIGTFKHYNGDVPTQEADFKKAIASDVCKVGGHAVIVTRTNQRIESASVIKYPRGFHL